MIRTRTETLIDVQDWDNLVTETYGRRIHSNSKMDAKIAI